MGKKINGTDVLAEQTAGPATADAAPLPELPASSYAPGAKPLSTRVKLLKPHTHAGKDRKAGDEITVGASARAWLIEHGVIEKSS